MAKSTCEESRKLPISFLLRKQYLDDHERGGKVMWSTRGEPRGDIYFEVDKENTEVRCLYTVTFNDGSTQKFDYSVLLTETPCYFGRQRYWFLCPMNQNDELCSRRTGILYMKRGMLGCRKCQDLAYESQQETHTDKWNALRAYYRFENMYSTQIDKIRVKYWRGLPTKRFLRVLKSYSKLDNLSLGLENMKF